jgi:hypothetical protein
VPQPQVQQQQQHEQAQQQQQWGGSADEWPLVNRWDPDATAAGEQVDQLGAGLGANAAYI